MQEMLEKINHSIGQIHGRLDRIEAELTAQSAVREALQDLWSDTIDIQMDALEIASDVSEDAQRIGYHKFLLMLKSVIDDSLVDWQEDEIHNLGEHLKGILRALQAISSVDEIEELDQKSLFGLYRESRSKEVRESLALIMKFLQLAHPVEQAPKAKEKKIDYKVEDLIRI